MTSDAGCLEQSQLSPQLRMLLTCTVAQKMGGDYLGGNSAINRLARSARELASFASYADPLLSHTEIVSSGPERHSDLGLSRNLVKDEPR